MSNLTLRVLSAVVGIPLVIAASLAGGLWFLALVCAASAIALHEFYRLAIAKGAQPLVVLGLLSGFFTNLSFFSSNQIWISFLLWAGGGKSMSMTQSQMLMVTLIASMVIAGFVELFRNKGSATLNVATTMLGVVYVSLFFGTFIGLRELFTASDYSIARYFGNAGGDEIYKSGGLTVVSVLAMIWICDTAAFHGGQAFGRHKLFPRVSPNKTWEGALLGFAVAVASAIAAKYLVLSYLPVGSAIIIGVAVGVAGQMGDLLESLYKRDAGVKDSSNFIPGHGGVLDRFDSLLLVAPLVYLYVDFVLFS